MTGAGMMDCKTALAETNGDMEAAVDWLRTKGIAKADKKAGRTAAEGLIGVAPTAPRRRSSKSTPRPTSSPATSLPGHRPQRRQGGAGDRRRRPKRLPLPTYPGSGQVGRRHDQGRDRHDRREHELPPLGQARRSATASSRPMSTTPSPTASASSAFWSRWRRRATRRPRAPFGRQVAMHVAATNPLALTAEEVDPAAVEREKRDLRRAGARSPASRRTSSRRWSKAACASSTRKSSS